MNKLRSCENRNFIQVCNWIGKPTSYRNEYRYGVKPKNLGGCSTFFEWKIHSPSRSIMQLLKLLKLHSTWTCLPTPTITKKIIKYTLKNQIYSKKSYLFQQCSGFFFFFLTHEKEDSRETLWQLIIGSTHTNPPLMDELPVVLLVCFACILIETMMRTKKAYLLLCVFS
jgi:hypothetical protein